jgi:hypothetical protein
MKITTALFCLLLSAAAFGQDAAPKKGYVPDSTTALRVAEAVLVPVYGQTKIESQRPFTAILEDDVWTVSGTLYCAQSRIPRELVRLSNCRGLLEVRISKSDGHILSMLPRK